MAAGADAARRPRLRGLIVWLYRREGRRRLPYKMGLAALRIILVLLAVFMLSEAVLSVERTGLPYFVGHGRRLGQRAGRRPVCEPEGQDGRRRAGRKAGHGPRPTRLAVAQGLLLKDEARILRELQKQHKVRLYLVSTPPRPLAEVDKPEDVEPAVEKLLKVEANGGQSRLGTGVRQVLTELRGVPPSAIVLLTDGQTTDGEAARQGGRARRTQRGPALHRSGWETPSRPATWS